MVLSPYLWQVVYVIYYVISRSIYIYQTNCSKMVKVRKELTVEQKNVVINMHKEHFSQRKIANILGVTQACICKVLKRVKDRNDVENLPRSGRPSKTDTRGDRRIVRYTKCHRKQTLAEITNTVNEFLPQAISARSVRRRLRREGFTRRKIRKQIVISAVNRRRRVSWCRTRLTWTVQKYWKHVIFSDETQVVIGQNRRVYVWRRPHEIWQAGCLGGGKQRKLSVMFWGCVTYNGVGILAPVDGNIDSHKYVEILEASLWPVVSKYFVGKRWIFQDDNAPVHRSAFTQEWKEKNGIRNITWPAQSPDINIIENIWKVIKLHIQKEVSHIHTRNDLITVATKAWNVCIRVTSVNYIHLFHDEFVM